MAYREIPLSSLKINHANDRHGELENETAAIAWLFNNREAHMKALAQDIVEKGTIYEPPLVGPDGDSFIVFDGNRRITCLKLLERPSRAPSVELRQFFEGLQALKGSAAFEKVMCQVEADRDRIDEILLRRHTGTMGGVGQSRWDDRMKKNFVDRTGKGPGLDVAEEVEKRLAAADKLPGRRKIPRSTLNRLLSSEAFRNRFGISVRKGKFEFTHSEDVALGALQRVASDLAHKEITLNHVWDIAGKRKYVDSLDAEGILPTIKDVVSGEVAADRPAPTRKTKPANAPRAEKRWKLIENLEYGIPWDGKHHRHRAIWEELQFKLELSEHPNAISVLTRVLIEISVDTYIETHKVAAADPNEPLVKKIAKVARDLAEKERITRKYADDIDKLRKEDIVSTHTLNRFVHSPNFTPSPDHMTAIWDTLSDFVVACLKG
jgi:hypothetical protein